MRTANIIAQSIAQLCCLLFQPLHLYVALQGAQAKSQEGCDYIPNDYSRKISRNLDPTRRCHLGKILSFHFVSTYNLT